MNFMPKNEKKNPASQIQTKFEMLRKCHRGKKCNKLDLQALNKNLYGGQLGRGRESTGFFKLEKRD